MASYSLNGTFLGLTDVRDQIVLCGERPSRLQAAWRVGVDYQIEVHLLTIILVLVTNNTHLQCTFSVVELSSQQNTPVFYDLCIL